MEIYQKLEEKERLSKICSVASVVRRLKKAISELKIQRKIFCSNLVEKQVDPYFWFE
jgi:hypothetical protein